jgi:hypothetical protein
MCQVSREASTVGGSGCAGDLGGEAVLVRRAPRIGDLLLGNGLCDGGMHSSSLSMESCSAIAIRMN